MKNHDQAWNYAVQWQYDLKGNGYMAITLTANEAHHTSTGLLRMSVGKNKPYARTNWMFV